MQWELAQIIYNKCIRIIYFNYNLLVRIKWLIDEYTLPLAGFRLEGDQLMAMYTGDKLNVPEYKASIKHIIHHHWMKNSLRLQKE